MDSMSTKKRVSSNSSRTNGGKHDERVREGNRGARETSGVRNAHAVKGGQRQYATADTCCKYLIFQGRLSVTVAITKGRSVTVRE